VIVGGALPWTGFVPAALRPSREGAASRFRGKVLILWFWFAAGLVFLSLGESKLATYVLPAIPALSIVIAAAIVKPRAPRWWHTLGLVTHAIVLAALPPLTLLAIWMKWAEYSTAAVVGATSATALVLLLAIRAADTGAAIARLSRLSATTVVGLFATVLIAAPLATPWMTARDLADTLNSGGTLPSRVLVLDERIGSLIFYLAPSLRREATPGRVGETTIAQAIQQARIDGSDWLLVTRGRSEALLRRTIGSNLQPDARAGTWVIYRSSSLRKALGVKP
jgi:4-amino-4-deoxy-L-arabinose transferase-like glycosyltransferase